MIFFATLPNDSAFDLDFRSILCYNNGFFIFLYTNNTQINRVYGMTPPTTKRKEEFPMKKRLSLLILLLSLPLLTSTVVIATAAARAAETSETKFFCRTETQVSNFKKKEYDTLLEDSESQEPHEDSKTNHYFKGETQKSNFTKKEIPTEETD